MIQYRNFRNPDPPALAELWNGSFSGRGAVSIRVAALLEYFTFAKPFFDPKGLFIAEADGRPVGFAHAGFGPEVGGARLDETVGVTCSIGVLPSHRRQGIGSELLRRCEDYLRGRGSKELLAGPQSPRNPFTFGLYGGSDSPGFLDSDAMARPFLEHQGYAAHTTRLVFQRPLERVVIPPDPRFAGHRQRYEIHGAPHKPASWWRECVLGPMIELVEYRLIDRASGSVHALMTLWEMGTFSQHWNQHTIGILSMEVEPAQRRKGLAKFLVSQVLRHLSDQYFNLAEAQAGDDNLAALGLLRGLGFVPVDVGRCFRRA